MDDYRWASTCEKSNKINKRTNKNSAPTGAFFRPEIDVDFALRFFTFRAS